MTSLIQSKQVWEHVKLALPLEDILADYEKVSLRLQQQSIQEGTQQRLPRSTCCKRASRTGAAPKQTHLKRARAADNDLIGARDLLLEHAKDTSLRGGAPETEELVRRKSQDSTHFSTLTPALNAHPPTAQGMTRKRHGQCSTSSSTSLTSRSSKEPRHHCPYSENADTCGLEQRGAADLFGHGAGQGGDHRASQQGLSTEGVGSSFRQASHPPHLTQSPELPLLQDRSAAVLEHLSRTPLPTCTPLPGVKPAQATPVPIPYLCHGDLAVAPTALPPAAVGAMPSVGVGWERGPVQGADRQVGWCASATPAMAGAPQGELGEGGIPGCGGEGRESWRVSRVWEMLVAAVRQGGESLAKELLLQLLLAGAAGRVQLAREGEPLKPETLASTLTALWSLLEADLSAVAQQQGPQVPVAGNPWGACVAGDAGARQVVARGGSALGAPSHSQVSVQVMAPVHIVVRKGA